MNIRLATQLPTRQYRDMEKHDPSPQGTTGLPAVPPCRGVFCNRTLNLRSISAIGYDMDYTLIHYRVAEWENRAYAYAKKRLLELGWPVEELTFDPDLMIQGLIVDTELGNLLKANRFGYVKHAFHGTRPLEFEAQRRFYSRAIVDHRNPRFSFLATLFTLSEACLFAQLVELWDDNRLPEVADYIDLYRRVRRAVDDAHREGALKTEIASDPDRFVELDPETPQTLLDQWDAGKKLMLITNSDWSYTQKMMTYAFDGSLPKGHTWRDLFHLVMVSARKPDFFSSRSPLHKIVNDEGLLRPLVNAPQLGGIYYGGNAGIVEETLGLDGDQILYVGDHFFGDVHTSKTVLRWRTALVMRELEEELEAALAFAQKQDQLEALMREKEGFERRSCQLRLQLQHHRRGHALLSDEKRRQLERELGTTRQHIETVDAQVAPLAQASSVLGHQHWGPLMRAGNDKSYLGHLIERHADIYTSRVSNLMFETPFRYFRSVRGSMPHDI